jgi:transcription elongation GreA/GreB family factor
LNNIIYVDQFLSTSILLRAADFHCSPFNPFDENEPVPETSEDNTIIRILIPPKTRGIALVYYKMLVKQRNYSNYIGIHGDEAFSEFEYLLPPGSILTLTKAKKEKYISVVRKELIHKNYKGEQRIKTVFEIPTYVYSCPKRSPGISRPKKQDTNAITEDNKKADSYWKEVANEEIEKQDRRLKEVEEEEEEEKIAAPKHTETKVFKVGDSVEVKVQESDKWIHAKVTSIDPLKAKPDLWPISVIFEPYNMRHYEYKIDDSVEVKTSKQSDRWVPGKVTSINPLKVKLDSFAESLPFEPHNMRLYEYNIGEIVEVKTEKNPNIWIRAKVTTTDPLLVQPDLWTEALPFEHYNMRPMPPARQSILSRIKSNIGKFQSVLRKNKTHSVKSVKLGGKIKRRKQRKQTRKGKKKFTRHK